MMKQWQISRFGVGHLRLVGIGIPVPGPHELLVQVSAVSLNYRDRLVIEGAFFPDLAMPFVPCSDAVGKVVSAGAEVTRFRPGSRVLTHFFTRWLNGAVRAADESVSLGGPLPGVLSEYIIVHESAAIAAPEYLSDAEASTLPIAALTAWWALFENKPLRPGDTVLVQGTGGVALFALQFASAAGARVIVTSSSDEKLAKTKERGAWGTINSTGNPDWDREILALTEGHGVDHVLEAVGGDNVGRSLNALARGGQIALIGFLQSRELKLDILDFMLKFASIHTVGVGHRRAFEAMNRALAHWFTRPVIAATYPLADAPAAFAHLHRGPFGKVVVSLATPPVTTLSR
jgi:NADPH:quinone reductase-like Zn-dependent oxidoreductase